MPIHPQAVEAIRLAGELPTGLSPEELRRVYTEQRKHLLSPALPVAESSAFHIPGRDGPIPVRLYRSSVGQTPRPLLVYFHGGGWMLGSLDGYDSTCRRLAAKGECSVLSVGYRLAPEHPFPAALNDALDATLWCATHAAGVGTHRSMLAVGGDSAGGNLAAVVALRLRGAQELTLGLQVLIYPVTDLSREHPSYDRNASGYLLTAAAMRNFTAKYVPDPRDRADPRVSPLLCADLRGAPRALVISAEFDPLVDENEAYANRLADSGVPTRYICFPGMIHPFLTLSGVIDAAATAEDLIAEELRALG